MTANQANDKITADFKIEIILNEVLGSIVTEIPATIEIGTRVEAMEKLVA